MRLLVSLTAYFTLMSGCGDQGLRVIIPDGFRYGCETSCSSLPDLAPPTPKCAAAKGLAGDNLLCADFPSPQKLIDLTSAGWNFDKFDKGCWTVANSKLQVNNFSAFASNCGFTLPALSSSDFQKYNSFTLSVVHRVDISEAASQTVQVMLGADDPLRRLVTQWTGKQTRQQSTMGVGKGDLPSTAMNQYQPLFKFTAGGTAGSSYQGWQIESIAVNGNL